MAKQVKHRKQHDETRRDVLIRRLDVTLWWQARVAAMEEGLTMADWLAQVIRKHLTRSKP